MIIELADVLIEIQNLYLYTQYLCRHYEAVGPADITVKISPGDIAQERERAAREDERCSRGAADWADSYLETLAVYRGIAEKMPDYDTFLFHGSAIAVDGAAYMFTAKSGTGKSTHTRLWREMLGDRAVMVNDDKPLVRVNADGTAVVYGTPWDGKHHLSNKIAVPLRAICILERAEENHIREITKAEALPMLLQQIYRPSDPAALDKTLTLIDRMDVQFYRLGCNMEKEAAEVSYNAMKL